MSLQNISLNKILKIMYLPENKCKTELRGDIRFEINKENGLANGGGDFYAPFWSDAKRYVAGEINLNDQMQIRIGKNSGRTNLYPKLATGFLTWWLEKRRWSNQSFDFIENSIKGSVAFNKLDSKVRVENLLALKIGDDSHRLIYPYFAKEPSLSDEAARLALWLMQEAIPDYPIADMRILDIFRAKSFSVADFSLRGIERQIFEERYGYLERFNNNGIHKRLNL